MTPACAPQRWTGAQARPQQQLHMHRSIPACRLQRSQATARTGSRTQRHVCLALFGRKASTPAAATRLRDLAQQELLSAADNREILQLVGELEALQADLQPAAFSGVWEVVWSDGALTWRALVSRAVQRIGGRCRAGQAFDVSSGRALNWAELWEGRCIITAQGRFQAASGSNGKRGRRSLGACPVPYQVAIEEGSLMVGERSWELPISGPGRFEVLYGDAKLRIFRSAGGLAVQVPSDFEI
mmetsp:Transcript_413/g.920  ORF Transcript_413/g.920 Transcript_413/m.920 type:complete len:242 (-) Transcript_413:195-920(-)